MKLSIKPDPVSMQTKIPPNIFLASVHLPLCKRGNEGDLFYKISPNPSFPKRGTERLLLLWLTLLILIFSMNISYADEPEVTIKKTDRCPVCGMFVYKYPKWVAQIIFKDGTSYFYDGAKDMFKHIFDTAKYTAGKKAENIKDIYVTDYYEVELVEAKSAFYVIGSDVLGPMGHELLPFKDQESAQEFLEDHKGKSIIRFQDVTQAIIESLDHRT